MYEANTHQKVTEQPPAATRSINYANGPRRAVSPHNDFTSQPSERRDGDWETWGLVSAIAGHKDRLRGCCINRLGGGGTIDAPYLGVSCAGTSEAGHPLCGKHTAGSWQKTRINRSLKHLRIIWTCEVISQWNYGTSSANTSTLLLKLESHIEQLAELI